MSSMSSDIPPNFMPTSTAMPMGTNIPQYSIPHGSISIPQAPPAYNPAMMSSAPGAPNLPTTSGAYIPSQPHPGQFMSSYGPGPGHIPHTSALGSALNAPNAAPMNMFHPNQGTPGYGQSGAQMMPGTHGPHMYGPGQMGGFAQPPGMAPPHGMRPGGFGPGGMSGGPPKM
uniref:Uncharacterized protein n=1 Tax=Acrobeloides nanus TaxID=290746 RepID=A0A914C102_9BILA